MYRYFMLLFALLEYTVTVFMFFYNIQFNSHLSYSLVFKNQVGHQDYTSYYDNHCHYTDHHCPYYNTSVVTLRTGRSFLSSSCAERVQLVTDQVY